jgi:hypothetical protein
MLGRWAKDRVREFLGWDRRNPENPILSTGC